MSQSDYTYRGSRTSFHSGKYYPPDSYPSKHYKSSPYGKNQEEKPMSYHEGFQLRLLLCIMLFAAFMIMDGKLITQSQKQFICQRLEEPMSRQTVETWTHFIVPE